MRFVGAVRDPALDEINGRKMKFGTVKWFSAPKGYGFIAPEGEEAGDDLFAYFSDIEMDGFKVLKEKQRVSFEVKSGEKGLQAVNIRVIKPADAAVAA